MMDGPVKFTVDDVAYTVDPETRGGQFLITFGCEGCRLSGETPLHGAVAGAMEAAIRQIREHHAEFHDESGSV
jgi:hypothetical protein